MLYSCDRVMAAEIPAMPAPKTSTSASNEEQFVDFRSFVYWNVGKVHAHCSAAVIVRRSKPMATKLQSILNTTTRPLN